MPEANPHTIVSTIGRWHIRQRPNGTHYAEGHGLLATFSEGDALFELSVSGGGAARGAMCIPTEVLGELLGLELARGDHPDRAV